MEMVIFQFQKVFFILYLNRKHKIYVYGNGYFSVSKSVFNFIPKSKVANEKDIRTSQDKEVYIHTHLYVAVLPSSQLSSKLFFSSSKRYVSLRFERQNKSKRVLHQL